MDKSVQKIYGNRTRIRVAGLCWDSHNILLVNHWGLYHHDFWAPPGGGVEFGDTAEQNLMREFKEETGLEIQVGEFCFACEFIAPPLHAIELYFDVIVGGGGLQIGNDPEMGKKEQIITEVKYMSESELDAIPRGHKHGLLNLGKRVEKIRELRGYLKI